MLSDFVDMTFWVYKDMPTIISPDGHGDMVVFCGNGSRYEKPEIEEVKNNGKQISEEEYEERFNNDRYECEFVKLYLQKNLSENDSKRMEELLKYIEFVADNPISPRIEYFNDDNGIPIIEISNTCYSAEFTVYEGRPSLHIRSFEDCVGAAKEEILDWLKYYNSLDNSIEENKEIGTKAKNRLDHNFYKQYYVPGSLLDKSHFKQLKKYIFKKGNTSESVDKFRKQIYGDPSYCGTDISLEDLIELNKQVREKYPPKKWWQIW